MNYILNKINESKIDKHPFYHMYIENFFPDEMYNEIEKKSKILHNSNFMTTREQDNKNFVNKRVSLVNIENNLKHIFESNEIKIALLSKFYVNPEKIANKISIHEEEFEFVYTEAGMFQNIHTDIPAKFLSMVFYIPFEKIDEKEELNNGTILYDADLNPIKKIRYVKNSLCIFAPNFNSYHGFDTTVSRTSLIMFYINKEILNTHQTSIKNIKKLKNYEKIEQEIFKKNIYKKLADNNLIEYSIDKNIDEEYKNCKINAPSGRIMKI